MRVNLTAGRVAAFRAPEGVAQAFLWDTGAPGLGLRATAAGAKAYIFQSRFAGKALRVTIGSPDAWSIPDARERARELQREIDKGRDPREVKAEAVAADTAARAERRDAGVTVAEAWAVYLAEGKPKRKAAWKPRYVEDLKRAAAPGGEPKKRGKGTTKPGHLWPLMGLPLRSVTQDTIRDWYRSEAKRGPIQAARACAMFGGFLNWCATRREFRALVDTDAARASKLGDVLPPTPPRREDKLEAEQVAAWWAAVGKLRNPTARAYLRAVLLTGARREEMAGLKWSDIDFQWKRAVIADKVGTSRVIPLSPYLLSMLAAMPRARFADGTPNPYVFASPTAKGGRIAEPRAPHEEALADAGLPHISIHGLRRSFALLGEEAGAPSGALMQIMGHRPSGVHEGYKPRSVDKLREYLTLVERFILDKAGERFDYTAAPAAGLRLVHASA